MNNDKHDTNLASLIQQNMENYWKTLSKTKLLTVNHSNVAIYTETESNNSSHQVFAGDMEDILRFQPSTQNLDNDIKTLSQFYETRHQPFCWWTASQVPWNTIPSETLVQHLIAHGFTDCEEVAGMAMDISNTSWDDASMSTGISIIEAISPKQFQDWITPVHIAFEMSKDGAELYKNTMQTLRNLSEEMLFYTAYYEDKPVASCSLFLDKEAVGIYNSATIPEFRKKGITSAVSIHSLKIAQQKNYALATLQASPYSLKLFQKLGFQTYIDYKLYSK